MASQKLVNEIYSKDPERATGNSYVDGMPQIELPPNPFPKKTGSSLLLTFEGQAVAIVTTFPAKDWFQVDIRLPLRAEIEYLREKAILRIRYPRGEGPIPTAEMP